MQRSASRLPSLKLENQEADGSRELHPSQKRVQRSWERDQIDPLSIAQLASSRHSREMVLANTSNSP